MIIKQVQFQFLSFQVDTNGQAAAAMAISAPNPITQVVPQPLTPQTPQHCYYEENMVAGWQNPSEVSYPRFLMPAACSWNDHKHFCLAMIELPCQVRQASTPRRSPMKSVMSLSNQLNQVALQPFGEYFYNISLL